MADTRKQGSDGKIVISKAAELDYFAHSTVLLENRSGFATAEWVDDEKALKLRRHTLDGSLVKDATIPVAAVYRELRVFGHWKVSICVSSGPTKFGQELQTSSEFRLGEPTDGQNLTADQIVEWDTNMGTMRRITIPNPPLHGAEFSFVNEHQIALAGVDNDPPAPLLTCFTNDDTEARNFSVGGTSVEHTLIGISIGIEGSSESSSILVHSFDRIAVFDREFLTKSISDQPIFRSHSLASQLLHYDMRVPPFALPGSLPTISNDRLLAYQKINRS
ncbi:hypothetical protein L218DRAFT_1081401 [Marasmius fiardii PR-910]|nr:hypothetical protein L218DRAFT_1081401 [Marasmius fiardii PR-910]